jgi:hypothetical protein
MAFHYPSLRKETCMTNQTMQSRLDKKPALTFDLPDCVLVNVTGGNEPPETGATSETEAWGKRGYDLKKNT